MQKDSQARFQRATHGWGFVVGSLVLHGASVSVDLDVSIKREFLFSLVIEHTSRVLQEMLQPSDSMPKLFAELPPIPGVTGVALDSAFLAWDFPGTYVRFEGDSNTLVQIGVISDSDRRPRAYFGGGRSPKANILAACFAIVVARLSSRDCLPLRLGMVRIIGCQ
jgi:hypothetical protein